MLSMTLEELRKLICIQKQAPPASDEDMVSWLDSLPVALFDGQDKTWLLAHTYGGIVWGRRDATGWHLSSELDPALPQLSVDRLLELRVFNRNGEVYVWRDGQKLRARMIMDGTMAPELYQQECQVLWGTAGEPMADGFTKMTDGEQSLMYVVPLDIPPPAYGSYKRPLRLELHHYITRDPATGLARLAMSRLVNLGLDCEKEKNDGPEA